MTNRQPKYLVLGFLVVSCGLILLALQHFARLKLREENLALQQQIELLGSQSAENGRLSQKIERRQSPQALYSSQFEELARLRTEVAAQKNEIQKLQDKLAVELAPPPFKELPGNIRVINVPRESWVFAGYSTPEAAFQTMLWATSQGDINAIRGSLTPAEQKRRLEAGWKDKTDSEIAETGIQALGKVTGYQILNIQMFSENEAHFTIYMNGLDQPAQPLWLDLKQTGDGWKSDAWVKITGTPASSAK
jgi:hypothetical protein